MNKIIILILCLSSLSVLADTNDINYLDKEGKKITYSSRNYVVTSSNSIYKVAQTPKETQRKKAGNCLDTAIMIEELAKKEGLKAEVKLVNNGKHAVCIVYDGVKKYKFSNGRRRL